MTTHATNADKLARLGARVRALREEQGLSQAELAARSGLHRTYIGGVERGERNVSTLNLFAIAGALGVRVGDLCDGEDRL
jgi:transcriptional regulator with XRE-family HTH domain